MEYESDSDTNWSWYTWNNLQILLYPHQICADIIYFNDQTHIVWWIAIASLSILCLKITFKKKK